LNSIILPTSDFRVYFAPASTVGGLRYVKAMKERPETKYEGLD